MNKDGDDKFKVRVALQVRIQPDSYDIGEQTIGVKQQIDPMFHNTELEWSTKRRGVCLLSGLLIKVEVEDVKVAMEALKTFQPIEPSLRGTEQ